MLGSEKSKSESAYLEGNPSLLSLGPWRLGVADLDLVGVEEVSCDLKSPLCCDFEGESSLVAAVERELRVLISTISVEVDLLDFEPADGL